MAAHSPMRNKKNIILPNFTTTNHPTGSLNTCNTHNPTYTHINIGHILNDHFSFFIVFVGEKHDISDLIIHNTMNKIFDTFPKNQMAAQSPTRVKKNIILPILATNNYLTGSPILCKTHNPSHTHTNIGHTLYDHFYFLLLFFFQILIVLFSFFFVFLFLLL